MKRTWLVFGLLALAATTPADAATLILSDRANWLEEVTALSNFDGGAQPVGQTNYFGLGGLALTNLQIDGYMIDALNNTTISIGRVNAGPSESYYNWGTGTILRTLDKTASNTVFARITFPNPVSAFGFNFGVGGCQTYFAGCTPGAAASVTIAPDGIDAITLNTVTGNSMAFWGVLSDSQTFSFADIYINDPNRYIVLDNIAQGDYAVVPPPTETAEPSTILQLAMGAGLLALARRRFSPSQDENPV